MSLLRQSVLHGFPDVDIVVSDGRVLHGDLLLRQLNVHLVELNHLLAILLLVLRLHVNLLHKRSA